MDVFFGYLRNGVGESMIKISIVTPMMNSSSVLLETLQSVSSQVGIGKIFRVQHIIIDGDSSDNSLEILDSHIRSNKSKFMEYLVISEPDTGMYDALVKGFSKCTGEVLAYQNAGDFYQQGAFAAIVFAFANSKTSWLHGRKVSYNDDGTCVVDAVPVMYYRKLLNCGYYGLRKPNLGFFQQESLFFRHEMLEKFDLNRFREFRLAGDFFLIQHLINHGEGLFVDALLSGHRIHANQLSANKDGYYREMKEIILPTNFRLLLTASKVKIVSKLPQALIRKSHQRIMKWEFETNSWIFDDPQ